MIDLIAILRDNPEYLYHYTDAGALLGIIQNKEF